MKADRVAGRPGYCAELSNSSTASPGYGECQAPVVEHRVARGARSAVDQCGGSLREPSRGQSWVQRVFGDRTSGAEGVAPDPKDDRVARSQHARGVGEDVRATFEDESHDAKTRTDLIDTPAIVLNSFDNITTTRRLTRPAPKTSDHVASHLVGELEAGRAAPAATGGDHVGLVGRGDRSKVFVVGQTIGELGEELGDRCVVDRPHLSESVVCRCHRIAGYGRDIGGDMQEITGRLHDDEPVTGREGAGELFAHRGDQVSAIRDGHSGG